jgi:hypothetical protein
VAGALESADRCLRQLLHLHQYVTQQEGLVDKFKKEWEPDFGVSEELCEHQIVASAELEAREFKYHEIL